MKSSKFETLRGPSPSHGSLSKAKPKSNNSPESSPQPATSFLKDGFSDPESRAYGEKPPVKTEQKGMQDPASPVKPRVTFNPSAFNFAQDGYSYNLPAGINRVPYHRDITTEVDVTGTGNVTLFSGPEDSTPTMASGDYSVVFSHISTLDLEPGTHEVTLTGGIQSEPGKKKRLFALFYNPDTRQNEVVGKSEPFAVAAYPYQGWKFVYSLNVDDFLGIAWGQAFQSDSSKEPDKLSQGAGDLTLVRIKEIVKEENKSDYFKAMPGSLDVNHDFVEYDEPRVDRTGLESSHSFAALSLDLDEKEAKFGTKHVVELSQKFLFVDDRTGITPDNAIEVPGATYSWKCIFEKRGIDWYFILELTPPTENSGKYFDNGKLPGYTHEQKLW